MLAYAVSNGQPVPPPPDGFKLIPQGGRLDNQLLMGYTEAVLGDSPCWEPEKKVGWISSPRMSGHATAGPGCFIAWAGKPIPTGE